MKKEYVSALQHLFYGHGNVPDRDDYVYSFRAVKAIAAGDGVLSEPERLCLIGRMCAIGAPDDVVDEVLAWDPHGAKPVELLARVGVPADVRRGTGGWIVYEGLSVALADGELALGELAFARAAAAEMGVPDGAVDAFLTLCRDEAAIRSRRVSTLFSTFTGEFRFSHE